MSAWCQGDVESIASKNPKELTSLFEQISGSEELKAEYEDLQAKKKSADEAAAFSFTKKRSVTTERKQKREQKEEAERHLQLEKDLVSMLHLADLFCFLSCFLSSSSLLNHCALVCPDLCLWLYAVNKYFSEWKCTICGNNSIETCTDRCRSWQLVIIAKYAESPQLYSADHSIAD